MSQRDFLNRRRWAIRQKELARAARPAVDYEAVRANEIASLKQLADALALLPHMADTLAVVRTRLAKLDK